MLLVIGSKFRPLPTVKPVTLVMASPGVESTPVKEMSAVVPAAITMTLVAEGVAELPVPETDALAALRLAEERLGVPEETLPVKSADVD